LSLQEGVAPSHACIKFGLPNARGMKKSSSHAVKDGAIVDEKIKL
jgi:hypothetical protein